jgi:putative SOS response-associated peptidase YedK
MPAILSQEGEDLWLDQAVREPDRLLSALSPYKDEEIAYHPVSNLVNAPRNDTAECVSPLAEAVAE